ncbi:MAG: HlyD family secretion protein [Acetobacteraceae bacterium]|nr:HlyD family secretion protein [Acetobacteraceae bacterium]
MDGDVPDPKGYDVHVGYTPTRTPQLEARPAPDGDDAEEPAPKPPVPRWKKLLFWGIGLAILAALIVGGVLYWLDARQYASTDDSYVEAYISQISPQIDGRVVKLAIDDFQHVKQGQVLLQLDPRDFQVKLDQARAQRAQGAAQLAQATAGLAQQQAAVDQAQANVRIAQADQAQAQSDLARYRSVGAQAVSRQQVDTASATNKSGLAKVDASRQAVLAAEANVEAQKAQIEAARASLAAADVAVANAELQLSYTTITAPRDGQAAKRTVNLGDYVKAGQSLLAVVGDDRWILANYKETQMAGLKVGQRVTMSVDACPDHELTGRVDSFQPGSGSVFSTLPPENATGNFVKVVQRIPVKITIADDDAVRCHLSPGMSVVPSVKVR